MKILESLINLLDSFFPSDEVKLAKLKFERDFYTQSNKAEDKVRATKKAIQINKLEKKLSKKQFKKDKALRRIQKKREAAGLTDSD